MKIESKTTILLSRRKPSFFLVFILQLVACSLWGQELQKKTLLLEDYPKWGELRLDKMSTDGDWVSYTMNYRSGLDTLFVKNTSSLKTFTFPLGNRGNFITPDLFVCQTIEGMHLLDLKTGRLETITDAIQYVYASKTKNLLILVEKWTEKKEKERALLIQALDGIILGRIMGVNEFAIDPTGQMVLYTNSINKEHMVGIVEFSKRNKQTVLKQGTTSFHNLVWSVKAKTLAFMQKSSDTIHCGNTIFYYNLAKKKMYHSKPENQNHIMGDSLFIPTVNYKLKISEDMQKVFFAVQRKSKVDTIPKSRVQLWNGNAKWVYPMEEKQKQSQGTYLGMWHPQEESYQIISNDTLPQYMLNGNQNYAIISNPKKYEPQYAIGGPRDFYLVDLATGKKELFLKKQSGHFLYTIASPGGKYIAYFRQKNWWVYDITKKTHTNVTKNIAGAFFHNKNEHPQNEDFYPNLGWTLNDNEILLCDEYDLWAIRPDGVSFRRLTYGKEIGTQFRLAGYSKIILGSPNYDGWIHNAVDLTKGLLLEATDKKGNGYYKWTPMTNDKLVFSTNTRLDQMIYDAKGNTFVYREQRYDLSPRLMSQSIACKKPIVVIQSNPQQQQFYWGKAERIQYKNAKGKPLQGILYYPAGYNNQKKYPMVVYIYEKLSHNLHNKYISPSQFTGDGLFNITTFTTQGYFVLAPDISYEIGDPGISATDCVVSATNEVIAQGLVIRDKIGLIGHSFGGYETDFIITRTKLFAAAVAGSAVTDLTSFYLAVGRASGKPDLWRFESQQWRMGKSLFEDIDGYNRNSPIVHAKKITTPLLSWTGSADEEINYTQSIEFYLALRRLKKSHIMLVYPDEGHNLSSGKNQKDLSVRIHQWFDYYLKDMPVAPWIEMGTKL